MEELSTALQPFTDRPFASLDVIEQVILAMGAWELIHARDLPVPVILDEAVDLTRRFGAEQAHGYVNAVLDQAAREWRDTSSPAREKTDEVDGI